MRSIKWTGLLVSASSLVDGSGVCDGWAITGALSFISLVCGEDIGGNTCISESVFGDASILSSNDSFLFWIIGCKLFFTKPPSLNFWKKT